MQIDLFFLKSPPDSPLTNGSLLYDTRLWKEKEEEREIIKKKKKEIVRETESKEIVRET